MTKAIKLNESELAVLALVRCAGIVATDPRALPRWRDPEGVIPGRYVFGSILLPVRLDVTGRWYRMDEPARLEWRPGRVYGPIPIDEGDQDEP
jgi:hypothetical protein